MTARGPGATAGARVVETHISVLLFVEDRVYKLRKPVRYDFLDFTDRAVREADCRREVALNRRLAPDVYLGVADVVMDGTPLDHLVVMRALPEDRRLAALVQGHADVGERLEEVAATLATFHAGARRSPDIDAAATPAALSSEWVANFDEVARFVGPVLERAAEREVRAHVMRWLAQHGPLLDERIAGHKVCDGHGDLQAEDIFCLDDGVRVLDCIEFSDELRYGDVCADIAFLSMDLERLGRPDAAAHFVAAYEEASGERFPRTLLHHYVAQRAYVRAKVACLRHEQGVDGARDVARQLHRLALAHLRRTRQVVLLVGGLPGTGKSTLARQIAAETGWALVRSDEVRVELRERLGEDRYGSAAVTAVYDELLQRARRALDLGASVVLDATWADAARRSAAAGLALESGAEVVEVCCTCDDEVAAARMAARRDRGADPSEATASVRRLMAAEWDPWPSALELDTSAAAPSELASLALERLAAAGQGARRAG